MYNKNVIKSNSDSDSDSDKIHLAGVQPTPPHEKVLLPFISMKP